MKTSNAKTKAYAFRGGAALITAAVLALVALFGMTGCPNNAGGGGGGNSGGGGTPVPSADKTYTVDGVSFTMKGIAAVTNGNVGHVDANNNKPHTVSLTAYLIGETEVTQELWQAVMGNNPSDFNGTVGKEPAEGEVQEKRPVEKVNWYHAIAFCNKLSLKLGLTPCYTVIAAGNPVNFETLAYSDIPTSNNADWNNTVLDMSKKGFRLPTEAEWEWAAKGGTDDKWAGTNVESQLVNYAWYDHTGEGNANGKTHEVKKKQPNGYGLYDMSGNVWEWCWDWYNNATPTGGQDPIGVDSGSRRIRRGGSCDNNASNAARASRGSHNPDACYNVFGLRVALRPESGGGSPTPAYVRVPYTKLAGYLNTASATDLHYIEVTGVTNNDLNGSGTNPSLLGQIIKGSGKKVALKLPAEITEIKFIAFIRCTGLERVDLSACTGLTKIDDSAFRECTDLKSVDLSGCTGLTTIGNLAFANCPIETLAIDCDIKDTICTNLTKLDSVKANLKTLKLGARVTEITGNAFEECKALKNANLADCENLDNIGSDAFAECTALESIDLSRCTNLTEIHESAFAGCSLLPSVDLSGCTSLATISVCAFSGCIKAEVKLPEDITAIADDAFGGNEASWCKKVLIKSGAEYARIKGLVTGAPCNYPEDRIGSY